MPTYYDQAWTSWTTTSNTTAAVANTTWVTWNSDGIATTLTAGSINAGFSTRYWMETDEERAAREERERAQRAEWARQAEERREQDRLVRERAEETLALVLTPEQLEDWRRTSSFRLITQAGHEYRIERGIAGNVTLIEEGQPVERLCAHPNGVPREDVVIAQVLALRTDEEHFRRTANITPMRRRAA